MVIEMNLSEKEAHCVARLLQGALLGENILDGCDYCKNRCFENRWDMFSTIRKRLTEETGVELGIFHYGSLPHSDYPYGMFLKNASETTKAYYRAKFKHMLGDI